MSLVAGVHALSLDAWSTILEYLLACDVARLAQTCPHMTKVIATVPNMVLSIELYGAQARTIGEANGGLVNLFKCPNITSLKSTLVNPCAGTGVVDCGECESRRACLSDKKTRLFLLGQLENDKRIVASTTSQCWARWSSVKALVLSDRIKMGLTAATSILPLVPHLQVVDICVVHVDVFARLCTLEALRTLRVSFRINQDNEDQTLSLDRSTLPRSLESISLLGDEALNVSLSSFATDVSDEDEGWPPCLTSLTLISICFSNESEESDIDILLSHMPPRLKRLAFDDCYSRFHRNRQHSRHHVLEIAKMPAALEHLRLAASYPEHFTVDCSDVNPSRLASIEFDTNLVDLITEHDGLQTLPLVCKWIGETSPFEIALSTHDDPMDVLNRSSDHPRIDDIRRAFEAAESEGADMMGIGGRARGGGAVVAVRSGIRTQICCSSYFTVDVDGRTSSRTGARQIKALIEQSKDRGAHIERWNAPLKMYLFAQPNQITVLCVACSASEFSLIVATSLHLKSARVELRKKCEGIRFQLPLARRRAKLVELEINCWSCRQKDESAELARYKRPSQRTWARDAIAVDGAETPHENGFVYFTLSDAIQIIMDATETVDAVKFTVKCVGVRMLKTLLDEVATKSTKHLNIRSFHGLLSNTQKNVVIEHFPPCVTTFVCAIRTLIGRRSSDQIGGNWHARLPPTLKYLVCEVEGVVRS